MFLKSLTYSEYSNRPNNWSFNNIEFNQINLIVGKNSAGKSRTLNVIHALARIVSGKQWPTFQSGVWQAKFNLHKGKSIEEHSYLTEIENQQVIKEIFHIKNKEYLNRKADGSGFVLRKNNKEKVQYKVPTNQLMSVLRGDQIQHPFFGPLQKWGQSLCHYYFGSEFGKNNVGTPLIGDPNTISFSDQADNHAQVFLAALNKFGEEFKKIILNDLEEIGYPCEDIIPLPMPQFFINGIPPNVLAVKEKDLENLTLQGDMSQGMFRALGLIIQINANAMWAQSFKIGQTLNFGDSPMIIIDDIGEGLDYTRSKKLINLLINKAKKYSIQLVMSTNDRFIMNDVPLEYWTVLHRKGGKVKAINYINSKDLFDEFQYYGLNNFDFFSGEYFLKSEELK